MSTSLDCIAFRRHLERALEGEPEPRRLTELSWHVHLLSCGGCRELLAREEALEQLLATLPVPVLSPALAQRVLARLRGLRDELDLVLDLDRASVAPAGLAERVASGVRAANALEEERLDALLERAGAVELPPELAARILARLEPARRVRATRDALDLLLERDRVAAPDGLARRVLAALELARRRPVLRILRRWQVVATAAAAAGIALLAWWPGEREARQQRGAGTEEVARARAAAGRADAELHAFLAEGGLEILDEPLLWTSDEDLELALAASLDLRYEAVLEYDEPRPVSDTLQPPAGSRRDG